LKLLLYEFSIDSYYYRRSCLTLILKEDFLNDKAKVGERTKNMLKDAHHSAS